MKKWFTILTMLVISFGLASCTDSSTSADDAPPSKAAPGGSEGSASQ